MDTRPSAPVSVPISQITVDPQLQPRVGGIDPDHVRQLKTVPDLWPPIKVVQRSDHYVPVDGFHRLAAAQNLHLTSIRAEILELPQEVDLYAVAFDLNATHGRPLSLADRRAYAARLLRQNAQLSDREIGRRCGLAQPTVAKVRHELERLAHIDPVKFQIGRDGRSYATPRPPAPQTVNSPLWTVASPVDPRYQRPLVQYLEEVAHALERRDVLPHFNTIDDAASACRAVLGNDGAKALAERLGLFSSIVHEIACALGYSEEQP